MPPTDQVLPVAALTTGSCVLSGGGETTRWSLLVTVTSPAALVALTWQRSVVPASPGCTV